jgi:hypothetical protein
MPLIDAIPPIWGQVGAVRERFNLHEAFVNLRCGIICWSLLRSAFC